MTARAGTTPSRHTAIPRLLASASGLVFLLSFLATGFAPPRALAAPTLGFVEEFPGTSTTTWSGGSPFSNPGTGGYLGPGDGYLELANSAAGSLGVRSFGDEYAGDWTAAGITQVRLWLNDVGATDTLEIHFSTGYGISNFWQYNVGFIPPLHAWAEFVVDVSSSANWTQIFGTGTFTAALDSVDRIHLRHDPPPFAVIPGSPDPVAADVGIDHILLTNGLVSVGPPGAVAAHPVELAPPYPNPSRGPVSFLVRARDAGPITIQIVDVAGRSVRRVELADAGSNARTWLWDGRGDAGRRVPAGYYRVRASGASGGMSRPLMRVD